MKIPTQIKATLALFAVIATICLVSLLANGCGSTPTAIAYKGEVATDAAVRTAMVGWGAYVAAKHPGTNAEQKVLNAFRLVKQSELVLLDATESLALSPTNTAPLVAAQNAVAASEVNLQKLISSLTNSVH